MLVRVWVVHVAQEGDYHVEVQGEVYGPYQPSLIFGRNMWNEPLERCSPSAPSVTLESAVRGADWRGVHIVVVGCVTEIGGSGR
jgi:hypothetical protein